MADKMDLPIGSKVVMELKDDGWFVHVDIPGKGATGLTKVHNSLEDGVRYVRDAFQVR